MTSGQMVLESCVGYDLRTPTGRLAASGPTVRLESILIRQNRPKYWSGVSSFDVIKWRSISSIQLRHIICAVRPENLFAEYAHSVEGSNHHRFFSDRRASNYFTVLHCKTTSLVELCADRIRYRCWRIIMNLPKVMRKKRMKYANFPISSCCMLK